MADAKTAASLKMEEEGAQPTTSEPLTGRTETERSEPHVFSQKDASPGDITPQTQDAARSEADPAADTESINSQKYQYRYEHGRRYHGFDKSAYLLPNDEREQDRLDGQHYMWYMRLGEKLHLAPLKKDIQCALDVATGTGIWAIEFADQYPSCKVIGTDLSPIQPNLRVSPNCTFIVQDSEDEWIFQERFDYIRSRTIASTWRDWPGYVKKAYKYLKPGGYLEFHEFTFPFSCDDGTADASSPMVQWSQYVAEAAAKGGVDMDMPAHLEPLIRDAGFVDIQRQRLRLPFAGWSDDPIEHRCSEFYGRTFDWSIGMAMFMNRLGWSKERAELFLLDARKNAADINAHAYIPLYTYVAKKPDDAPE